MGEFLSKRLVPLDLDYVLPSLSRESGRHAEYPGSDSLRSSPPPAAPKGGGTKHMEELVGEGPHLPKQRVAAKIIYRSSTDRELVEFFDAGFHYRPPVVESPGTQGMDTRYVGEKMTYSNQLEVSKQARIGDDLLPHGPAALDRAQSSAV